ncbi:GspE/PulE family protein [Endothiovibrio diazotrophicus]
MLPGKKVRIGDLLIEKGIITSEQLQAALKIQKESGKKLGKVLVEMGLLTSEEAMEQLGAQSRAPRQKVRLGDLLVENGIITDEQLKIALTEQKKSGHKLGRTLTQLGFTTDDQMLELLSKQLDLPLIDLKHYQYNAEVVHLIPETVARRFRAIALAEGKEGILVGMSDPTDIFAFDELTRLLKRRIQLAVVREADLIKTIDQIYRRTDEITSFAEVLGEELSKTDFDLNQLVQAEMAVDAPVVKLLQSLFEDAVQVGASDIHIEPDETALRIRQRIDGVLHEQVVKEVKIAPALVSRLKLMSGLDISEKRLPQDGRFNIKVQDKSIDVRVSTMPIQHGESVVMRLLDQSGGQLTLDQLGLPPRILDRLTKLIHHPHGMVLVTGPTGSGKTTTLYSALNVLNTPQRKIITVEDPVEYRLPRINQVQVHEKIGLTFSRVLRTALRQDPDVVLVGEMRDSETMEIGMRASLTGHLVLSTLHTNDAVSTATRLIDMGAEGYLVASSLLAVVAQRLVRRICETCIEEHRPDPHQQAFIRALAGKQAHLIKLKRGRGCPHCNNTGYRGRVGVYELLELDGPMAEALRRNDADAFTRAAKANRAFKPLKLCALEYAARGLTTLEEVIRLTGALEEVPEEHAATAASPARPAAAADTSATTPAGT